MVPWTTVTFCLFHLMATPGVALASIAMLQPRKLVLEFTKMNGAGNDFIVIDNRFYNFSDEELADLARRFCPRRISIGADGVLAFSRPTDPAHHYRMRYVNADGSVGTMCGNGARCLARFARFAGVMEETVQFETDAGVYSAFVPPDPDAPVRLFVPPPQHWSPHHTLAEPLPESIDAVHLLWTGTEHAICFVNDTETTAVGDWGPSIRHDAALAPAGANVDFVQVLDGGSQGQPASLRVRTFEKGVEQETLACGTGALASALVARFLDHIHTDEAQVQMPGGVLGVGFQRKGEEVSGLYLEGPAATSFRGTVEV